MDGSRTSVSDFRSKPWQFPKEMGSVSRLTGPSIIGGKPWYPSGHGLGHWAKILALRLMPSGRNRPNFEISLLDCPVVRWVIVAQPDVPSGRHDLAVKVASYIGECRFESRLPF